MEGKRIYLLAQFDKDTNNKLSEIYGQLVQAGLTGTQTKGIPYHFTLGSFDLECGPQVMERAQTVSLKTKAFDISLSYIGLFSLSVLFIAPSVNAELINLYRDLVPDEGISGCHKWVAHASILIDSADNIQAAVPIVARSFYPFAARIESIGVYEFFPLKFLAEYKLPS